MSTLALQLATDALAAATNWPTHRHIDACQQIARSLSEQPLHEDTVAQVALYLSTLVEDRHLLHAVCDVLEALLRVDRDAAREMCAHVPIHAHAAHMLEANADGVYRLLALLFAASPTVMLEFMFELDDATQRYSRHRPTRLFTLLSQSRDPRAARTIAHMRREWCELPVVSGSRLVDRLANVLK